MSAITKKYVTLILGALMLLSSLVGAQVRISDPAEKTVSHFKYQFVAGTAPAGLPVVLQVNGVPADSTSVRPDGVFEFLGVETPAGPVTYKVTVRMPNGRNFFAERTMHRVGAPDSIGVDVAESKVQADGKSLVKVRANVLDQWGIAIPDGYFVTMFADSLQFDGKDADPNTPGFQVKLENGVAEFSVKAPRQAGPTTLLISANGVTAKTTIEFTTPIQPLMIVGSMDATGSLLSANGDLSQLKNQNLLDDGFHSDGRIALFGRGSVWNNYLLTMSVDNTRRQSDRLFKELDPDVLYSIYGDNSTVDYTAQTSNPFFVKLEQNRSYAMFGDFNTGFAQNEMARYDRTFTGVKSHYETKTTSADVFVTLTDRKVVQDEIRGQGISGYYFLGNSNIVTGSEKVRIEVRDKVRNDLILSRSEKSRFGDYEVDYQQGTLFFKQPIASLDGNGNPVYIVVVYESQGNFATSYVTGVQAQKEVIDGLSLGVTGVSEQRDPKNYMLLGANTTYKYDKYLSVAGEFAHSSDFLTQGNAWKVEANGMPMEQLRLKSYYRTTDQSFGNQTIGAGGLGEIGARKYGFGGMVDLTKSTRISAEYYNSLQDSGHVTIQSTQGTIEQEISKIVKASVKAENILYNSTSASSPDSRSTTSLEGKAMVRPIDRLSLSAAYEHSFASSGKEQVKPSVATLMGEYRVFDWVSLSATQKFYGSDGTQSGVGVSSDVGFGTTVTGRYEIRNGINGRRNQTSMGLKNSLNITEELTSNFLYERTRALDRNVTEVRTEDADAISLGLEYLPKEQPYRLSIKGEYSKRSEMITRGGTFGGDIRLGNEFTLIEKLVYYQEAHTLGQNTDSSRTFSGSIMAPGQFGSANTTGSLARLSNIVGLAYRPTSFDWFNAIGKFEKKYDFNGLVSPQTSSDVSVVSLHTFIEPVAGLEIGTKYALKYAKEEAFGLSANTFTDFYLVRAEYDLRWKNFDVAGEYRILNQREANNSKSGYSLEIGNGVFENVRIGVGYNFVGTYDRDLVGYNYWSQGPFVTMRAKFTEKVLEMFNK
jgi:hypothetical protein